jgi:hypothetical protein
VGRRITLLTPSLCASSTHTWPRFSAGMAKASTLGTSSRLKASSWAGSFFYGSGAALSNWPPADSANSTPPQFQRDPSCTLQPSSNGLGRLPRSSSQTFPQGLLIVFGQARPPPRIPARQQSLNPAFPRGPYPPPNGVSPPTHGRGDLLKCPVPLLAHPDGQEALSLRELLTGFVRCLYRCRCRWATHFQLLAHGRPLLIWAWLMPSFLTIKSHDF